MYDKKKKQTIITMSLMMIGLLMCLLPSQVVHADDKLENGYFDIEAKPNTEQTVMINLSNSSKKPITVNISVNGTKTNSNGVLEDMKAGKIDADKSKQTINYVVTSLAGYSVKKASTLNTVEGQRVLNRYYQSMSELGINISKNSGNLIEDQKVLNDSLTDIEKAQTFQKKAMDFFLVDVSVLEKQK